MLEANRVEKMDPVIDMDTIKSLQNLGSEEDPNDFLRELIDTFFKSAPSIINDLILAIRKKEMKSVNHLAHKLKGMSYNLGAKRLGLLCQEIEHQSTEKNSFDGDSYIAALPFRFNESEIELKKILLA